MSAGREVGAKFEAAPPGPAAPAGAAAAATATTATRPPPAATAAGATASEIAQQGNLRLTVSGRL